jgi:integrase
MEQSAVLEIDQRTKGQPDMSTGLAKIRALVLHGLESAESQRKYAKAMDRFLEWWMMKSPRPPLSRALLLEYRDYRKKRISAASVNLELSALRRLATEAADAGLIPHEQAHQVSSVKGLKSRGVRMGNWMTLDTLRQFLPPTATSVQEKRDRAILAVLAGCGLRRKEVAELRFDQIQIRDDRPVFLDITGKGNKRRTVAIPLWVYQTIQEWREAAGLEKADEGPLFRRMDWFGHLSDQPMTDKTVYRIAKSRARAVQVEIAPHDLRRTCAKLCREYGGRLEDIQAMLGHASLVTTQRYLGAEANLRAAPNDLIQP